MRSYLPLFGVALAVSAPVLAADVVPVPSFRSVQLRGGGEVLIRPGSVQRVMVTEGSARISRFHVDRDGQLRIDVCDGNCPRRYRLRVEIQSPFAPDAAIAGGGLIRATGGFPAQRKLSAAIMGGGKIDMLAVSAGSVHAAVHGGGLITVRARSQLSAAVNGGGEVRYAGNPTVSSAVNGGGAVHRIDR
jgi:hypothetical protein